jgi:3,2-trans-enoyl-CoA isomerase
LVLSGAMVDADAALRLGLVDELFDDGAALLARAEALMEDMVALPPPARAATKASLRAEFCAEWRGYYSTLEAEYGWRAISAPAAVKAMAAVLKRLSGKGKAKM